MRWMCYQRRSRAWSFTVVLISLCVFHLLVSCFVGLSIHYIDEINCFILWNSDLIWNLSNSFSSFINISISFLFIFYAYSQSSPSKYPSNQNRPLFIESFQSLFRFDSITHIYTLTQPPICPEDRLFQTHTLITTITSLEVQNRIFSLFWR